MCKGQTQCVTIVVVVVVMVVVFGVLWFEREDSTYTVADANEVVDINGAALGVDGGRGGDRRHGSWGNLSLRVRLHDGCQLGLVNLLRARHC